MFCPVLFCPVLFCPVLFCPLLFSPVVLCIVLFCLVLFRLLLFCPRIVMSSTVLLGIVLFSTVLTSSVLSSTLPSRTVLSCTVLNPYQQSQSRAGWESSHARLLAGRSLPPSLCSHHHAANTDYLSENTALHWEETGELGGNNLPATGYIYNLYPYICL